MTPTDDTALSDVRDWLRERVDDGERCPCCAQFAKVYRRKVTSAMARVLILVFREAGTEWVHLPTLLIGERQSGGDPAKLRHWHLLEELEGERPDGSSRVGWWRVTPYGAAFVRGVATVPKYARIYDGRVLGYDGDAVTIRDALGTKFDYAELMAGI